MENAVSYVVGKRIFNKQVKNDVRISTVITAGDEALALLLLENSWEHWREQYNMGFEDSEDSTPDTSLTTPKGKFDA